MTVDEQKAYRRTVVGRIAIIVSAYYYDADLSEKLKVLDLMGWDHDHSTFLTAAQRKACVAVVTGKHSLREQAKQRQPHQAG